MILFLSLNKKTLIIIASCKAKKIRLFPPERAGEFFLSQPDRNEDDTLHIQSLEKDKTVTELCNKKSQPSIGKIINQKNHFLRLN